MALQSSGQIKISEIATELGVGGEPNLNLRGLSGGAFGTINTNNAAADRPDGNPPHAISEFYSYNHSLSSWSNDYALDYDGVNDYVEGTVDTPSTFPNREFSVSMWVRIDNSSKRNMHFYSFSGSQNANTNGYFFLHYSQSANRLIVRFRTGGGTMYQRQYPLHDNSSVTGITSSSNGWRASQRGNTDSAGFTHLMACIDSTNSNAVNGIKTYWNGSELTSAVNNLSNSVTITPNYLGIGETPSNSSPSGGCMGGVIDEVYLYDSQLSASNVSTIYGYGRNSENTFTTDYVTAWRMENNVDDEEGLTSLTRSGATFISTP